MSAPEQQLTKKLAEMKSFLERRLKQQEEEVNYLRSFLEVVDSLLAERSFRRVEIKPTAEEGMQQTEQPPPPPDSIPIMTTYGVRIASMSVGPHSLEVIPEASVNLDSNSPPLRSFLVAKVLEPMLNKDKEAAAAGSLLPDNMLTYDVKQEGGRLKAIVVRNYGDDRRLLELKNAIRWTLRRMYEKTPGGKG
ncbi:MAG TPA: hypothetical protein VEG61_03550 [Candidatus Dormibacteraeota bacterium]|nr:hypothetical protein [Candidatus Dormibacteraeota bacterium]